MDNLLVSGVNLNAEKLVRVSQLNQSIFFKAIFNIKLPGSIFFIH